MGLYAKECLAESDVCGDVENRGLGEMMEIEPIKEQETLEKGVEREAQTSDEVGDEDHPLPLARSGDGGGQADLVCTHGRSAFNCPVGWNVPVSLELDDGTGGDGGGHPLPSLAGDLGR